MGDPVPGVGNATPTNQTTNASESDAQSQAKAQSLFDGVLKSVCPPCTFWHPQPQPDLQLHKDVTRGPTESGGYPGPRDDYNKPIPQKPDQGLQPPHIPGDASYSGGLISGDHGVHGVMIPIGKQAPKPTPEQQQNQTPYQPPR